MREGRRFVQLNESRVDVGELSSFDLGVHAIEVCFCRLASSEDASESESWTENGNELEQFVVSFSTSFSVQFA